MASEFTHSSENGFTHCLESTFTHIMENKITHQLSIWFVPPFVLFFNL